MRTPEELVAEMLAKDFSEHIHSSYIDLVRAGMREMREEAARLCELGIVDPALGSDKEIDSLAGHSNACVLNAGLIRSIPIPGEERETRDTHNDV